MLQESLYGVILDRLRRPSRDSHDLGTDAEAAATVMSWAIFGAGISWSRGDDARSADGVAREIVGC